MAGGTPAFAVAKQGAEFNLWLRRITPKNLFRSNKEKKKKNQKRRAAARFQSGLTYVLARAKPSSGKLDAVLDNNALSPL